MHRAHIYITVDSEAPRVTRKQYGYVLQCEGKETTVTGFGAVDGTYHHAVLTALVEGLKRFNQSCEIHIHSGNTYILDMLKNYIHKWAAKDFKTSKGKPVSDRELWIELWRLMRQHLIVTEPGKHEFDNWLKLQLEEKNIENT